jgi:hypothetical protein
MLPPAYAPKSESGKRALRDFDEAVSVLNRDYDEKYKEKLTKLLSDLAAAREQAVVEGDLDEAERLISLQVDLPRRSMVEPRRVFAHSGGHFEQAFNGLWIEFVSTGDVLIFQEISRNSQFIELSRIDSAVLVRLYEDRAKVKFAEAAFNDVYVGGWQTAEMSKVKSRARRNAELDDVIREIRKRQP